MERDAKKQPKYGIQTTVDFDPDGLGMAFEPAQSAFVADFEKLLQDMQSVTEEVVRVISHGDFRQFIHGLISDSGPRFRVIVEGSLAYQTTKVTITKRLIADFEHLSAAVEKCGECRDVNDFEQGFVFDDFKAEHEHADLDAVKTKLEDFVKWEAKINLNIKNSEQSGLVVAQAKRLRDKLSKKVKEEQRNMKEYLRELADAKAKESAAGL
jgi:hypothetical protein